MRGSLKIARIGGIDIGIHYTWILAFFIFGWSLAQGYFPQQYKSWTTATYWTAGFLSAILMFISVLLHELAHSLVAQARGLPVSSITLFIFGGVSNLSEEPDSAGQEFIMAIVGPLTSLALAGIFWGIWYLVTGEPILPLLSGSVPGNSAFIVAIVGFLAYINITLAAFNLLPGFPLDGGRVLRSIIWKTSGNLVKATDIASIIGRIFGWGFIAVGVWFFWRGDFLGAIWIAIIGFFLTNAAETSRQEVTTRELLTGVQVGNVMELNMETVSPRMTVAELVRDVFLVRRRRTVPVAEGDRIIGMVSISDVRALPQEEWPIVPVERIMTREPLHAVKPEDDLNTALKVIAQYDLNQVPVLNQGKLVGILSRANVINFLQLKHELGMKSGRGAKQRKDSTPMISRQ
jgi:Zn-dependent protease/CBS domain-containing protein